MPKSHLSDYDEKQSSPVDHSKHKSFIWTTNHNFGDLVVP